MCDNEVVVFAVLLAAALGVAWALAYWLFRREPVLRAWYVASDGTTRCSQCDATVMFFSIDRRSQLCDATRLGVGLWDIRPHRCSPPYEPYRRFDVLAANDTLPPIERDCRHDAAEIIAR